jgi:plasmid stabilization system protein ParE
MPKSKPPHSPSDWKVRLTHSAEADIDAILDFIAGRDGVEQTEALLRERLLREEEPLE